jgi:hypothetical protein
MIWMRWHGWTDFRRDLDDRSLLRVKLESYLPPPPCRLVPRGQASLDVPARFVSCQQREQGGGSVLQDALFPLAHILTLSKDSSDLSGSRRNGRRHR